MTLWLDRRAELRGAKAVTHALVIGVSDYRHLPPGGARPTPDPTKFGLVGLASAASGAWAFARWLRDEYANPEAPLATVSLLLSPAQAEREREPSLVAAAVPPADRSSVRDAVLAWQAVNHGNRDGYAVLFAGGHGVRTSQVDAYLLLADFAADQLVMDYALDIGSIHRGMAGNDLPQTQFSFIDACRIRPGAFDVHSSLGHAIGLPERSGVPDERVAPIYFSASPGASAYGLTDRPGTLFSTALLECLRGGGVDDRADATGSFVISSSSLLRAVNERVAELAASRRRHQRVVLGGQGGYAVLHRFPSPPEFSYAVQLDPDAACRAVSADVWDYDRERRLISGYQFTDSQARWCLPMGCHSLDLVAAAESGFTAMTGLPLVVQARQHPVPRRVKVRRV